MKVSYRKMWVTCAERELSQVNLRRMANISPGTYTKLRKNEEVSLSVLMKIAQVLECDICDIVEFVKESDE